MSLFQLEYVLKLIVRHHSGSDVWDFIFHLYIIRSTKYPIRLKLRNFLRYLWYTVKYLKHYRTITLLGRIPYFKLTIYC